ncbi:MAG: hypothetical protein JSV68_23575 [Anaerolineaceae bacterium]|nr:MAG: hypothetical protein JSV68_23575 [Anaerolineaceae bacterium]
MGENTKWCRALSFVRIGKRAYNGAAMKFEAIIFDFNGVQWWDGHLQDQVWKQFSAEKRGIALSEEEMAAAFAAGIGGIFALGPKRNQGGLAQLAGITMMIENLAQFSRECFRGEYDGAII